jgi:hypothetical protein
VTDARTAGRRAPRTPQEFRRFVTEHHPDRGGDTAVFAAGVAAWRERQRSGSPVVFYRKRTRRARLVRRLRLLVLRTPRRGARPPDRRLR